MVATPSDPDVLAIGAADDLEREVYCVLGLPIDVIEMPAILRRIECCCGQCYSAFHLDTQFEFSSKQPI